MAQLNWPALIAGAIAALSAAGNAVQVRTTSTVEARGDATEMVLETLTRSTNVLMDRNAGLRAKIERIEEETRCPSS